MAPYSPSHRRPRPPLDAARLDELALAYVGRFATSRAKLRDYLKRKLRERGWAAETAPDLDAIAERLTRLGYVDDAAYASMKARSLLSRGYGERRVGQALHSAGIGEQDGAVALGHAASEAVGSALHFARRRRLGPFADVRTEGPARDKAISAFLRAGHRFALARTIVDLHPGDDTNDAFQNEIG